MGMKDIRPKLSVGNHIYLYQLLSSALGCGKQTLMPRVEEALESERMTAEDLGYESTRELLEELDDFVDLTVFKGGRVYATIVAQPAWDEALAAPEKKQVTPAGKPWKRKKADKGLKAVKPKRVKRPEPEPEPEPEPVIEPTPEPELEAAAEVAAHSAPTDDTAAQQDAVADAQPEYSDQEPAHKSAPAPEEQSDVAADDAVASPADESGSQEPAPAQADAAVEEPQPAISLTVVYDPENANAGMKTLVSTPGIAMSEVAAATDAPASPQESTAEQPMAAEAAEVTEARDTPEAEAGRSRRRVHRSVSPAAQADEPRAAARRHHAQPAAQEATVNAPAGASSTVAHDTPAQAPQAAAGIAADQPSPAPSSPAEPATQDIQDAATAEPASAPQPHDAEHASHASAPALTPAPAPAAPAPAPTADARPVQSGPTLPAGYPDDLTVDAFCSGALLSEISYLLPYGADVMGILDEYYHIALLRGTLACTRNRATFPMGYAKDGKRCYATVCIKRNTAAHGAPWVVDSVQA